MLQSESGVRVWRNAGGNNSNKPAADGVDDARASSELRRTEGIMPPLAHSAPFAEVLKPSAAARAARLASRPVRGRVLLSSSGNPLQEPET
jgi:hypothetical protein